MVRQRIGQLYEYAGRFDGICRRKNAVETIRTAGPNDLSGIVRVERETPEQWSSGLWSEELRYPGAMTLVAEMTGQVVAVASFRTVGPEAELLRVAVLKEYRRGGIATRLLMAGLGKLSLQEVETCYLEVRRGNLDARGLYHRLGFVVVGERPKYYKDPPEDAVLMRLDLPGPERWVSN